MTDTWARRAGTYRINGTVFPAPVTSWDEQELATGLNALPVNTSYRIHQWDLGELDVSLAQLVYTLYELQQSGNAQLTTLETDPYDASLGDESYGTQVYTDFIIRSVSTRTRGYPFYSGVTIVFEVYVG